MNIPIVILSGGLSKRFGGNKLIVNIDSKPMIRRIVESIAPLSSKIFLSVDTLSRYKKLIKFLQGFKVAPIIDIKTTQRKGPFKAIYSSLSLLHEEEYILFIPGDTPWISSDAIENFIKLSMKKKCDASTIFWSDGKVETLIQLHKANETWRRVKVINRVKKIVIRPSDILRGVNKTLYVHIGKITENPMQFANINTPDDIKNPKLRGKSYPLKENIVVNKEVKRLYLAAISYIHLKQYDKAINTFLMEKRAYDEYGLSHIAKHCLIDSLKTRKIINY